MLYHYTDFIALDGIVGSAELRLNNVLNMNDASEMRFYMEGICGAVVQKLKARGLAEKAEAAENFFENELKEVFSWSAYAACFSRYRDDAAQWERYGNFGQGVCISFDEAMLRRITAVTGGAVSMKEVRYDQNFSGLDITDQFSGLIAGSSSLSGCMGALERLMNEAWITSAAFKHPSFANEKEMRMVVIPLISASFPVTPKYHVSLGRIKKYYPMDLHFMCEKAGITMENLIREIMIGPTSTQSPAILSDYLRDRGYGKLAENVLISQCPLRKPNN